MNAVAVVRERLVARRARLAELAAARNEARLTGLLRRVDAALGAIDVGTWGTCALCREPINTERLASDPLVTVCLECLSNDERRALERDLEGAARVQRALLPPRRVARAGWEVAYLWEPRGPVSGDHVDVLPACGPDEPLQMLVGDVVGKGVAASLLQSHLHALFRALAGPDEPLGDVVGRAGQLFWTATAAASYATLVALRLHVDGRVDLANAGHPRPLLADRRGVRPVEGGGLPLGLVTDAHYAARTLSLSPGETLLVYTDGWTEAARGDDEEYGIGRAAAALRRNADAPLDDVLAACRSDLETFLAGTPRLDDLTLVAVRRSAAN